ncbi:PIG-L deacetylase family protein [Mycobacterium sp.]|uniref:PIG-L deacetylase family protein n=1 Tax=Mycobacterium sp. TaxID=1785 RepID=UPI003D1181B0
MDDSPLQRLSGDWQRALAVVAHPDDVEYGMAATVAHFTRQGKWIGYLLASRGEAGIDDRHPDEAGPLREAEQRAAAAMVGVDTVEFLGYPDGTITYSLDLRSDIAVAIRRHRPEVVFTANHHDRFGPGAFNMADHRAVGLAAIDAVRDAANRWVFSDRIESNSPAWQGVSMIAVAASPQATHAVDITDTFDVGLASLAEHRVYLAALGPERDPVPMLRTFAEQAGRRLGTPLAAAFEVIDP